MCLYWIRGNGCECVAVKILYNNDLYIALYYSTVTERGVDALYCYFCIAIFKILSIILCQCVNDKSLRKKSVSRRLIKRIQA